MTTEHSGNEIASSLDGGVARRSWREPSIWWLIPSFFLTLAVNMGPHTWIQTLVIDDFAPNGDTLLTMCDGIQGGISLVMGPMIGGFSDRIGRKPMLILLAVAQSMHLVPLALFGASSQSLVAVLGLQVASGLAGSQMGVAFAYVVDTVPRSKPEKINSSIMILMLMTICPALFLSPTFAKFLFARLPQLACWRIFIGISAMNVLYLLFVVPESRRRVQKLPGADTQRVSLNPFVYFRLLHPRGPAGVNAAVFLIRLSAICICMDFGTVVTAGIVPLYAREALGWSSIKASIFMSISGIGKFISCFFAIIGLKWLRFLRDERVMATVGLSSGCLAQIAFCVTVVPWVLYSAHGLDSMMSVATPPIMAYAAQMVEGEMKGEVQGLVTTMTSLSKAFGSPMYGALLHLGVKHQVSVPWLPRLPFMTAALFEFSAIVMCLTLPQAEVAVKRAGATFPTLGLSNTETLVRESSPSLGLCSTDAETVV